MATKAELEKELSKLREELSESKKMASMSQTSPPQDIPEETSAEEGVVHEDIIASIEEGHLDTIFQQVAKEVESFSNKKPVLMALGVFGLGFLLGRSGRKN